ncbi:MAG TPA: DPP IV N-terminal domain-containing protein [Gemmatimonadaceae bacterium]|nr:DPP IV N-terminal domain-containing protein [Gemmatimonadaceae bacterium]
MLSLPPRAALPLVAVFLVVPPNVIAHVAPATATPALSEPSPSPDHREIAFVSGGDIWTVPYVGGEARLLVSHPATESRPLYSPDGTQLAFVSNRSGNGDVYVLTLATGDTRRITWDDVNDQLDGWSRDGKWLYFSSTSRDIAGMSDVYRVRAAGGTPMIVAGDRYATEYWSAPSPDGATIAITARGMPFAQWWRNGHSHLDESEIWLVHDVAVGSTATPRYEPVTRGGAKSGWPMWSPDGATIYFMSDRSGSENLWSRAASGGEPRQLTRFTSGRLLWPAISADGRAITFERDCGVWTYDVAGGQAHQVSVALRGAPAGPGTEHLTLTNGIQQLALSPDAKKVAFVVHGEVFAASAKDGGDAARVTDTPGAEEQIAWAPDSRRLAYSSDRNGAWNIYLYDFATRTEKQLTRGRDNDITPRWSPDGTQLAFERGGRELHVLDVASGADRKLATAWLSIPPFVDTREVAWSPDGKWLAYVTGAGARQFANVFVVPASGGESRQVSWLSNGNGGGLSWSPDGTFITLSSGQRTEDRQAIRIDLVPRTPHFREDQFRDLFSPTSPARPGPRTQQPQPGAPAPQPATPTDSAARRDSIARAKKDVTIVFEDIRKRVSALPTGLDVGDVSISPDGKSLLLVASAAGQTNLYAYSIDDLSREQPTARQLTSTPGFKSAAQWSPDGKEVWYVENGRINSLNVESRAAKPLSVSAEMDVDFDALKMAVFNQAWSFLRDNFFDARMRGTDWKALHDEYGARVDASHTPDEMRRVMNLMIGELNASHMGIGGPPAQQPYTGRLGLRFDRAEYERDGRLRITEVVPLGPSALGGEIHAGDLLTAVDGHAIDSRTNLDELLAYRTGKQTVLSVTPRSGAAREVMVLPVSAATAKGLMYRVWVESRRDYVNRISGGRLGYVHMYDMGEGSLRQLYEDLDAEQVGREGVVVDVRNNNGGFVNPYALDVLSRRPYLTMQFREQPAVGARSALGQRALEKPTILVTNQHSLSDAEDFTEGYRAMHLGKVVGEPTAGWIIFTSNRTLLDGTSVRLPSTRITDAEGKDMEMHPRPVDVPVVRPIGESYSGKDSQLDAAVRELLAQLGAKR